MPRGRTPKPTQLKVLEGNPGKRPLNPNEPEPRRSLPKCPNHLDVMAKKKWRELARRLYECGILTEADVDLLAIYCMAWSRLVRAYECWGAEEHDSHSRWQIVIRHTEDQLRKLATELGMTPSSRSRIHAVPPDEKLDPVREKWRRRLMGR